MADAYESGGRDRERRSHIGGHKRSAAGPANHSSEVRKNTDNGDEMRIHTVLGPALVAAWLSGLHRLRRGGALAARPAGDVHETKRGFDPTLMIDLSATEV